MVTRCTPPLTLNAPVSTRCRKCSEEVDDGIALIVGSLNAADAAAGGGSGPAAEATPWRSCAMYDGNARGCGCELSTLAIRCSISPAIGSASATRTAASASQAEGGPGERQLRRSV